MMIQNLNQNDSTNFLANNYIGYLAYIYRDRPFIAPITYFFDSKNTIIGYSNNGHKTIAMQQNKQVSLEVAEINSFTDWTSVLAHGVYEELTGVDAKSKLHEFADGIKDLILRKEEKNLHFIGEFSSKINKEEIPLVFKITLNEITGKTRNH